jgi:hypothetical protein
LSPPLSVRRSPVTGKSTNSIEDFPQNTDPISTFSKSKSPSSSHENSHKIDDEDNSFSQLEEVIKICF